MKVLFKIVDYLSAVLMGTGTLFLVTLAVSKDWNMFFAMIVGMILGTVVLVITILLFFPVSSTFELFPPGMIITMFTGMSAAMAITMGDIDFRLMLITAVLFSILVQITIDLYNRKLKGDFPLEDKNR